MMISHKYKVIFIHNYKVAGTSNKKALNDREIPHFFRKTQITKRVYKKLFPEKFRLPPGVDHHSTALQLRNLLPPKIFETYYKFGFVRNPLDWLVSLYGYILRAPNHKQHELVSRMGSYEAYLHWIIRSSDFKHQKDFFYEGETCLVDRIGRYESLNQDFQEIAEQTGIFIDLPHLNPSRSSRDFLQFYTPETVELVWHAFQEDFRIFGYTKPQ